MIAVKILVEITTAYAHTCLAPDAVRVEPISTSAWCNERAFHRLLYLAINGNHASAEEYGRYADGGP